MKIKTLKEINDENILSDNIKNLVGLLVLFTILLIIGMTAFAIIKPNTQQVEIYKIKPNITIMQERPKWEFVELKNCTQTLSSEDPNINLQYCWVKIK